MSQKTWHILHNPYTETRSACARERAVYCQADKSIQPAWSIGLLHVVRVPYRRVLKTMNLWRKHVVCCAGISVFIAMPVCHRKTRQIRETASVTKKRLPGRPRTVRTAENVDRARVRRQSVALQLPNTTVRRVLHKDLSFILTRSSLFKN
jgi:hypothetical protein